MEPTARRAQSHDVQVLVELYRTAEEEQRELKEMWPLADGLAEPVDESLEEAVADPDTIVVVGELLGYPLGLGLARVEPLLPQAGGEHVGSIRLLFTDPEARRTGVGEAMVDLLLSTLRERGIRRFDAHVLPGHRDAKNFFEASGFAARSIVMHRQDQP